MKPNRILLATAKSPILWGAVGSLTFYALVYAGPLATPLVNRYFTHHPVEYGETVLFAVGLAALVIKTVEIIAQKRGLGQSPVEAAGRRRQPIEEHWHALLEWLDELPWWRRDEYYPRRLRAVVKHVHRHGTTAGLDDELKYLADLDAARQQTGYGLFRVIIWAIPILGFLGTVIGITMALNGLNPAALDESMLNVTTGLGVKFDTTALALSMSMLLMFCHFFVERAETALLEEVDRRVEADLAACLPSGSARGGLSASIAAPSSEVIDAVAERLLKRQTELWQASMEAASARWTRMADASGEQVKKAVAEGLAESVKAHAQHILAAEKSLSEENRRQWEKLQQNQSKSVEALAALQAGMARQAEVLHRAIEASGEVIRLQDVLNRNLAALGGAKHIEQTVMGLAAAIHLLNARLAESPASATSIQLEPARRGAQAA